MGDRPRALLAALAARGCRAVPAEDLIELVWGDEAPLNGMKSLQVLVSRARTACGAEAIVRDGTGYRLGAAPDEVDSERVLALVNAATGALDRDAAAAAALAREALELTAGLSDVGDGESGPLAEVRRVAAAAAAVARVILARASSRTGAHADAFPALAAAYAEPAGTTNRSWRICCAVRPPSVARRWRLSASSFTGGTCVSGSALIPASCSSGCSAACWRLTGPCAAGSGTTRPR